MKISDSKNLSPIAAPSPAKDVAAPAAAQQSVRAEDRVTTGSAQELQRAVGEAETRANEAREARVAALAQAVERGEYSVNPDQVAERMLDASSLGGALRQLVGR